MSETFLEDLGRVDNLNDPVPVLNKRAAILGIVVTFLTVSSLCAFGRLWIRVAITHTPGVDDLFVLLATLSNITGGTAVCILGSSAGLGQHIILLGADGVTRFLKTFYFANAFYPVSTTLIKLALLLQYLRVLERGTKLRKFTVAVLVVVSVWGTIFGFLALVPCIPVWAFWDLSATQATRYAYGSPTVNGITTTFYSHAATNMLLDLIIFAIPMPLWLGKNVASKTRTALIGLFVLGATVNICSVCRLVTLADTRAGTWPTFDPSWYAAPAIVLSALEVHLATICASLPVYWPIIKDGWAGIVVTREVQITREHRDKRTSADSSRSKGGGGMTNMIRMNSVDSRPWERIRNVEDGVEGESHHAFVRCESAEGVRSAGRPGRSVS